MASELKRGAIRIASNYAQLAGGIVLGLLLVPLILEAMGTEALGLIGLLGSSVGIARMAEEITRRSIIRELAEAHHSGDPLRFCQTYNAALLLALVAGLILLGSFAALIGLLGLLKISDTLIQAAAWFVVAKAIQCFVMVLLAPTFNMYQVTERFVPFNIIRLCLNTCNPIAAAWMLLGTNQADDGQVARAVITFGFISAGLYTAIYLVSGLWLMYRDRRLIPSPRNTTAEAIRSVLSISRWQIMVTIAMNLHVQLDNIMMNWIHVAGTSGLLGNAVFDPALRLTSYLRRAVMGVTRGSDAVAARMSSTAQRQVLGDLLRQTTRLHGLVAFPVTALLIWLADPIVTLWILNRIDDVRQQQVLTYAVSLIQIMAVGTALRAVSDGWIFVFYGAGHIRRYAPVVLVGGILNPIVVLLLIAILPQALHYAAPAWAYTSIFAVVHMVVVPMRTLGAMQMGYGSLVAHLLRPLGVTLATTPLMLLFGPRAGNDWTLGQLAAAMASFLGLYGVLSFLLVLDGPERRRLRAIVQHTVLRSRSG